MPVVMPKVLSSTNKDALEEFAPTNRAEIGSLFRRIFSFNSKPKPNHANSLGSVKSAASHNSDVSCSMDSLQELSYGEIFSQSFLKNTHIDLTSIEVSRLFLQQYFLTILEIFILERLHSILGRNKGPAKVDALVVY